MTENVLTPLSPEDILSRLRNPDSFLPEAALQAAEAMPETMTPLFLENFERIAADPSAASDEDGWLAFFSLFLLARYKEGGILPILQRIVEIEPEYLIDSFGDAVTELGDRLFASWAFSSPHALRPFIEKRTVDQYTRAAALKAYQCLYCNGLVTVEEMRPYLHALGENILRRGQDADEELLWYEWVQCCRMFGLKELSPLAKQAYDEQWISPMLSTWESQVDRRSNGEILADSPMRIREFISDVTEDLRGWHCFSEEYRDSLRREKENTERSAWRSATSYSISDDWSPRITTFVREDPKVGRNAPCPCGSGKKYKKCCGK